MIGTVTSIRDEEAAWPDLAPELDGAPLALIPKGEYQARVTDAAVRQLFNTRRLVLTFTILGTKYAGIQVPFICLFPPSRVSPTSRFYRAWIVANGGQKPRRGDRLSLAVFKNRLFRISLRDVERDRHQQPLADSARYSVVATILEREA